MQRNALELDKRTFKDFSSYQQKRLYIAGGLATLVFVAGVVLIATGHDIAGLVSVGG